MADTPLSPASTNLTLTTKKPVYSRMLLTISHTTVLAGTTDLENAWNAAHAITGPPGAVMGFDANGNLIAIMGLF